MTTPRTAAVIWEEQDRSAAEAMARAPREIAALIERAPCRLSLALTLQRLYHATSREAVRYAAGQFDGIVLASQAPDGIWTPAEFEALTDYGHLAESTALARLEE